MQTKSTTIWPQSRQSVYAVDIIRSYNELRPADELWVAANRNRNMKVGAKYLQVVMRSAYTEQLFDMLGSHSWVDFGEAHPQDLQPNGIQEEEKSLRERGAMIEARHGDLLSPPVIS